MGSTSVDDKPDTMSRRAYMEREYSERCWGLLPAEARPQIVRSASYGAMVCFAVRFPAGYFSAGESRSPWIPADDGSITMAIVVKTRSHKRAADGFSFSFSSWQEDSGPRATYLPHAFLDCLSQLDETKESGKWAAKWREDCRSAANQSSRARKTVARLRHGAFVILPKPLHFNSGASRRLFRVRRSAAKPVYEDENGGLYKLRILDLAAARVFEF